MRLCVLCALLVITQNSMVVWNVIHVRMENTYLKLAARYAPIVSLASFQKTKAQLLVNCALQDSTQMMRHLLSVMLVCQVNGPLRVQLAVLTVCPGNTQQTRLRRSAPLVEQGLFRLSQAGTIVLYAIRARFPLMGQFLASYVQRVACNL